MKKILMFIFSLWLVTGCSNNSKTLTCTTSLDEDIKTDIQVIANWENDTLKNLQLDTVYYLETTLSASQKDSFKTYVDTTMSSWSDINGVKYESEIKDNTLSISLKIDASKGKEALEKFSIDDKNSLYDDFKASLEEKNYICK